MSGPVQHVIAPNSLTPDQIAETIKLNPGLLIVHVGDPSVSTAALMTADQAAGHHRSSILGWIGTIEAVLVGGLSLFVPAPAMALVTKLLDGGTDLAKQRLSAEPGVERWPLDKLAAERDGVAVPAT